VVIEWRTFRRRFENGDGCFWCSSRQDRMLHGIVKAVVILGAVVLADQFLTDGTYTDAALSMLRQIEHSIH
jgi:hypothetical protein